MHNILLFKATEIASSLPQHRISPAFTLHYTLIKRCLLRMSADGKGSWVSLSIKLMEILKHSAVVHGGVAAASSSTRQK